MLMIAGDTVCMLNDTNLHSHQLSNRSLVLRERHCVLPNNPRGPATAELACLELLQWSRLNKSSSEIQNSLKENPQKQKKRGTKLVTGY